MDAFLRFPPAAAASARARERALSLPRAAVVPLSPRALFEAIRQRESDHLHAHGTPDPDGELALVSAATEMRARANNLSFAMEGKLRRCRHHHYANAVGEYVPLAEHDVYAAFARYIGCVEAAAGGARSGSRSSSALAAFHRAMPLEQRDDEWRAVDAVLHQQHHYHHRCQ
jgi:hypothetical protein